MNNPIIKPRCPSCGKVVADMVIGTVRFTCPRCKIRFEISNNLTEKDICANTLSK